MKNTIIAMSILLLAGCSSNSEPEAVAVAGEPLSNHEHCDSGWADTTITIDGSLEYTSALAPRSYTHPDCNKAYLVNVMVTGDRRASARVQWMDSSLTTEDLCNRAQLLSYAYQSNSFTNPENGGVPISNVSAWGLWTATGCVRPQMDSGFYLEPHHTYRFAISARQTNPNGSATREVGLIVRLLPPLGGGGSGPL
jgi:hypothetical protein